MIVLAQVLARSGEAAKSGPIGLAVILILCVVCYFLFKSMSRHLRRVREQFPSDQPSPARANRVDLTKPGRASAPEPTQSQRSEPRTP